jgi:hypothetical protein
MPAAKKLQYDGKPFGCRWAGNQLATATVDFTLFVHQQFQGSTPRPARYVAMLSIDKVRSDRSTALR